MMSRMVEPRVVVAPGRRVGTRSIASLLCLAALLLTGCGEKLDSRYGVRQAASSAQSVNGVTALGHLFTSRGHQVSGWRWLSPRLQERADVIVWFPDSMQGPDADIRTWLEDWLLDQPGRTLIYVGRDYDAAITYWQKMRKDAPEDQLSEINHKLSAAAGDLRAARSSTLREDYDWFTVEPMQRSRRITTLEGDPAWLAGIDPAKTELELHTRLVPPDDAELLLASEGESLVSRQSWGESQLIVVTNGSFLLNLPLVNREHRKLAGRLVDEVGPGEKQVYFLEPSFGMLTILEEDPDFSMPTGLGIVGVFPFNHILLHLAILGALFCWARYAIFGIPQEPSDDEANDFGQHVMALGELFEKTGDYAFAELRLRHYHQLLGRGEHDASATPGGSQRVGPAAQRPASTQARPSLKVPPPSAERATTDGDDRSPAT